MSKVPSSATETYKSIFDKYEEILYRKDENIATITLNRPEKKNAFGRKAITEINDAMSVAEWDDDVKVIVFKGAGDYFCSGGDLNEVGFVYGMEEPKSGETKRRPSQRIRLRQDRYIISDFMRHVLYCDKVTIVQAHGYCVAGGMVLAENCDLTIASEDCKLGYVEERLGFGGLTCSPILILRVGLTKALELQITGKMIDGKEAERINLINRAVRADKLESEVNELAGGIALYSRDGLAIAKAHRRALYEGMGLGQHYHTSYLTHTIMTNMRWEPDEFNFFKERRDKGLSQAIREKNERFSVLDK